jgi:hypothetical protein
MPLCLGCTQEDIKAAFGTPDHVSTQMKNGRPSIFKYEDIEFHFDHRHGHRLWLIYSEAPDGTPRINVHEKSA